MLNIPILPTNRTNQTPQVDTHAADHNAAAKAINDLAVAANSGIAAWATVPGLSWFVAGGAGSSSGQPRVLGLANLYMTKRSKFANIAATGIRIEEAGVYRVSLDLPVSGAWSCSAGVRLIRGSADIASAYANDSRGTWGNPAGVTGFDGNYVKMMHKTSVFVAQPGDTLQVCIYTAGGADAGSIAGGPGSQLIIEQMSALTDHVVIP